MRIGHFPHAFISHYSIFTQHFISFMIQIFNIFQLLITKFQLKNCLLHSDQILSDYNNKNEKYENSYSNWEWKKKNVFGPREMTRDVSIVCKRVNHWKLFSHLFCKNFSFHMGTMLCTDRSPSATITMIHSAPRSYIDILASCMDTLGLCIVFKNIRMCLSSWHIKLVAVSSEFAYIRNICFWHFFSFRMSTRW